MKLHIQVEPGAEGTGFTQAIKAAAEATLQDQGIEDVAITVVLTDEAGMSAFNRQFAGLNNPTDVLSFPDGERDPDTGQVYLGDVIVCPAIALAGAARGRHSLLDELCLLTVHGVLHLLAHDHDTEQARSRMWAAQSRIMRRLGNPAHAP